MGKIEDKIDELDESFTEQAPEDIALWGVENAPSPGKKKIPRIAESLSNLHESRIEIKKETIAERIDGIATYEKWEEIKERSYSERITTGVDLAKEDIKELNEIRERLGTYRDQQEFEPLNDLSEDESKSRQAQKSELMTEHEQLHQLREIEEQRRSNVGEEWYNEQIGYREQLIEDRIPIEIEESSEKNAAVENDTEERAATEKEENEQEQPDELQQVKEENRRLRKALQEERDENQELRGENQELRDALQAAKDKYATLQEKFQTLRDDRRQRETERKRDTEPTAANDRAPETDDPQTEASDRSNSSPVATAAAKLRGGVTKSAGAARTAVTELRGQLSRAPDKPYPAQHATNIHTTGTAESSESESNAQPDRDEERERSVPIDNSVPKTSPDRQRANGQDEPDRGRF